MKQENDDYQANDDGLFDEVPLKSTDGGVDQPGAVIARNDFDARRQRSGDLGELAFNAGDHVERVQSIAHYDNAADRFASAIPFGDAAADVRPERHASKVPYENRRAVLACHRNCFKIRERADITESADHVLGAAKFQQPSADLV